ncbi:TSC22 domain family protein 4 [Astatotilapia calliptera]|nr:TSC22 domain family protein 4-like [Astatotilapia calliptera]XP_026019317.1 TSC22 domain family protein 4-like [Astatotilapia calliptera]
MSGGKKRSGFQITSVTSEVNQSPADQLSPSAVLPIIQSEVSLQSPLCSPQGSSSQPTTPSLKRKYVSLDGGQGAGSSSRFRVVRLVSGAGGGGRGESYRRGRWMCTEFTERQEGPGFRRVMDSMRHAHSLESLEMIGRESERGGVHSQDNTHMLAQHVLHSGPPSPTHQTPANVRLLDHKESRLVVEQGLGSTPPPPSPRPRFAPTPLRLDVDASGRSVLRLSHSQPGSPPAGLYQPPLTPAQTPSGFSLDRTMFDLPGDASSSSTSLIAIDNKIEQAMDLVKSHLMLAVREEVELLREQIRELQERNRQLERENHTLRALTHSMHTQ